MSHFRFHVRTLFLPAAAAVLVPCSPAAAQPAARDDAAAAAPAAERSPFLGEWELDLTRMPETYGPPPKRVTFTFEDVGSGLWRTEVAITAPDDSVRRAATRYRRDGRAVPIEGDRIEGESAAMSSPAPNVLVMNLAGDGGLESVRVLVISANGREMTDSAAGVDGSGVPFVRQFHFRRVR